MMVLLTPYMEASKILKPPFILTKKTCDVEWRCIYKHPHLWWQDMESDAPVWTRSNIHQKT